MVEVPHHWQHLAEHLANPLFTTLRIFPKGGDVGRVVAHAARDETHHGVEFGGVRRADLDPF
jgi:hypothetical protein